jgi:hypothetical protein
MRDGLHAEIDAGHWFALSDEQRADAPAPWGPKNPQTLNRYAYVLGNPLTYSDPSGHNPIALILAAFGITVTAKAVAVIAAAVVGATLIVFLSDANNRAWLDAEIRRGTLTVRNLVEETAYYAKNKKTTRQSGADGATNIPSWAANKGVKKQAHEDGKTAAERVMNEQYGKGNWEDNPDRKKEHSELKKYFDRKKS